LKSCNFNLYNLFNGNVDNFIVSVDEFCITNTYYPINDNYNKIVFNEGAADLTATLTNGGYSGSEIAFELQTQLNAVGGDTYSVTYSNITKKITISSSGTFKILSSGSANDKLGFQSYSTLVASYTGDNPVNLLNSLYVDVISSMGNYNSSSSSRNNILCRIHLNQPFGSIVSFNNFTNDYLISNDESIDNIEFRLIDDNNNPYIMAPNSNWSLILKFTKVE
jgi:hypothetical protein